MLGNAVVLAPATTGVELLVLQLPLPPVLTVVQIPLLVLMLVVLELLLEELPDLVVPLFVLPLLLLLPELELCELLLLTVVEDEELQFLELLVVLLIVLVEPWPVLLMEAANAAAGAVTTHNVLTAEAIISFFI